MAGLTKHSREARYTWAVSYITNLPANPRPKSIQAAVRIIESYELYHKTHDADGKPITCLRDICESQPYHKIDGVVEYHDHAEPPQPKWYMKYLSKPVKIRRKRR
jgi:hypothetical protein